MIRLLIGGSPCTYWSIAQTKNRETEASGMGWELFLNYVIARDKYKPDFFIYENNKSMSNAIKTQITNVLDVDPVLINSALVSAQNRQRFYWVGYRDPITGLYHTVLVALPADRGILLRDVLETGVAWREKAYTLKANYARGMTAQQAVDGGHFPKPAVAELLCPAKNGKARSVTAGYCRKGTSPASLLLDGIPNPEKPEKQIFDFVAEPVNITGDGKAQCLRASYYKDGIRNMVGNTVDLAMEHSKTRRGRRMAEKGNCLTTTCSFYEYCGTVDKPIYQVKDCLITIKGKQYPIKLRDGWYIIRKLTVLECMRLQTVPETYIFPVSDTQAYKMLGNGWTVDVIAHIMSHFPGITTEPVEVLSMYDGMSCGHIALDKLGSNVTRYYATEIDKYAIQTTLTNYPDTVQLGDAFQVREPGWTL